MHTWSRDLSGDHHLTKVTLLRDWSLIKGGGGGYKMGGGGGGGGASEVLTQQRWGQKSFQPC